MRRMPLSAAGGVPVTGAPHDDKRGFERDFAAALTAKMALTHCLSNGRGLFLRILFSQPADQ